MTNSRAACGEFDTERWELVIGLETHVQLVTASKMFCGCSADYAGAEPNTHTCPVCLGLPGSLPVPNARAVELATRAALALGCSVTPTSHFDRKNYHYPDLPKGYQITQSDAPLGTDGRFTFIGDDDTEHSVGIERVHLEEDTGKLLHTGTWSLVDFNRAGVPLIEIVTRPELTSADEAKLCLESLRQLLRWLGISTGNMEAGALRADVNVSVRPRGSEPLGVKVEIKNLNSFAAVRSALEYEAVRLAALVESGAHVAHETRGWSEAEGRTMPQRSKELAHDYRYFPEPDLPPLVLDGTWLRGVERELPELPTALRRRLTHEHGLGANEARLVTRDRATAEYFAGATAAYPGTGATMADWITGPLFGVQNSAGVEIDAVAERIPPRALADLAEVVREGGLTLTAGRDLLTTMYETGAAPRDLIARHGLGRTDDAAVRDAAATVIAENPRAVADFCGGKDAAIAFLVGRVMRATGGQADANLVRDVLRTTLSVECAERATALEMDGL